MKVRGDFLGPPRSTDKTIRLNFCQEYVPKSSDKITMGNSTESTVKFAKRV